MEDYRWHSADDDGAKYRLDGFLTDHSDISMQSRDAFVSGL